MSEEGEISSSFSPMLENIFNAADKDKLNALTIDDFLVLEPSNQNQVIDINEEDLTSRECENIKRKLVKLQIQKAFEFQIIDKQIAEELMQKLSDSQYNDIITKIKDKIIEKYPGKTKGLDKNDPTFYEKFYYKSL